MRSLFLFLFLFLALGSLAQADFSVDKATHKFPKTKEGTLLEHNYKITNTGNAPLIISDYHVQCTCTKVILPKKPIAPGETYLLKVTFDTNGKYYFQDRIIELQTNAKKPIQKIRLKANVVPKED